MDVLEAIKSRRSANFFNPSYKMSDKDISELLELAAMSPSSYNIQPWEIIVVRSAEKKKLLRECAFNQAKVEEASAVLIVIGNTHAPEENLDAVGRDLVEKGYADAAGAAGVLKTAGSFYSSPETERRKLFATRNAGYFAMSFMLAAQGKGYVTHPMDGFDEAKIKKAFNINDDKVVVMLIGVGKLAEGSKLHPHKMRFPVSRFARFE